MGWIWLCKILGEIKMRKSCWKHLRSNASFSFRICKVWVLFDEGQVVQPQVYTERDGLQASSVYLW